MAEIQHLKADAHDACKICRPNSGNRIVTDTTGWSPKSSRLPGYSRRALIATHHKFPRSDESSTSSLDVETSTPIRYLTTSGWGLYSDPIRRFYDSTYRSTTAVDSGLYEMFTPLKTAAEVPDRRQRDQWDQPFQLNDDNFAPTTTASLMANTEELYSLFQPEDRHLSEAYEAFTDWARRH